MDYWYVLPINPIPWKVGSPYPFRNGKKMMASIGPNPELVAFKEAVAEELRAQHPLAVIEGPVRLELWLWRSMEHYLTPQARGHRKHQADATNMQKAIEDALQGIVVKNDKQVQEVHTTIVKQAHDIQPCIVIHVTETNSYAIPEMPERVVMAIARATTPHATFELPSGVAGDNEWF